MNERSQTHKTSEAFFEHTDKNAMEFRLDVDMRVEMMKNIHFISLTLKPNSMNINFFYVAI